MGSVKKAYLDLVGGGDFYTYEKALEIIENKVPNRQNRQTLIELTDNINEKGTVAKARAMSADKKKFKRDLKLLNDTGINGAFLNPNAEFARIENPIDEIIEKCRVY